MGGNLKEGGKEGLQEGAYSLYPREINIYFLRGVLYIYSTERVAKERDTANKKREKTRGNVSKTEHLRDIWRYCEIVAITLFGQI
jgi:hypothetical protein